MTSATSNPPIYPVYCHDISPTIGKWCPLRAVDVHKLQSVGMVLDGKPLYHYGNHPVKWVRLTGVLVAIDDFYQRRVYTLDDSSGECMECTCALPPPPQTSTLPAKAAQSNPGQANDKQHGQPEPTAASNPQNPSKVAEGIDIGSVIKVKGKVCEFRGMKQIEISSVVLMRGTEEEVRCWNESLEFRRDILSKPWIVEPRMEEKMRKRSIHKQSTVRKRKDPVKQETYKNKGGDKGQGTEIQTTEKAVVSDATLNIRERKKRTHAAQRMTGEEKLLLRGKTRKDQNETGSNTNRVAMSGRSVKGRAAVHNQ